MNLTTTERRLVKRLGETDDCSLTMTPHMGKYVVRLKALGLVDTIPNSRGPDTVCLTTKGIEEYERTLPEDNNSNPQNVVRCPICQGPKDKSCPH